MQDIDLPDPKPRELSNPQQAEAHLFQVLYSVTLFAVLYSSIHKLWIPLFLSFTKVSQASYREIDYWIIPAVILWWKLWRSKGLYVLGSLMCGALIVHGAIELWHLSEEYYKGWLLVSHLLSSVPLALVSIAWLSLGKKRFPNLGAAWTGAMLGIVANFATSPPPQSGNFSSITAEKRSAFTAAAAGVSRLSKPDVCGQKAFWAKLSDFKAGREVSEIKFSACGFQPALVRMDVARGFVVKNEHKKTANVHVLVFQKDGRRHGFNRVLRDGESWPVGQENFKLAENEALIIYSDEFPESGLTAVFPNEAKGAWQVSRSPLAISGIEGGP